MNITILKNFNNYFNRIIKGYETLQEYIDNSDSYYNYQTLNFNPNDGVETSHVLNINVDWRPDYFIVTRDTGQIESRWFVLEATRTRGKQFILKLKRDTITDFKTLINDCPIYVENAILKDSNDPAIYNKEDISLNQIKTSEYELRDSSRSSAIVIYFDKKLGGTDITIKSSTKDFIEKDSLPSFFPTESKLLLNDNSVMSLQGEKLKSGTSRAAHYKLNISKTTITDSIDVASWLNDFIKSYSSPKAVIEQLEAKKITPSVLFGSIGEYYDDSNTQKILSYNNKIVKDGSSYYKLSVHLSSKVTINNNLSSKLKDKLNEYAPFNPVISFYSENNVGYIEGNIIEVIYTPISNEALSAKVHLSSSRIHTTDSNYDICYLYKNNITVNSKPYPNYDGEFALDVSTSIATQLDNACYDVQVLPYAPSDKFINKNTPSSNNLTRISSQGTEHVDYEYIFQDTNKIGILFYANSCQRTFNISIYQSYLDFRDKSLMDIKIANECDMVRLCEGNYNSQFEFTPARNGTTFMFNVDMTFIPHSPYIHINPNFANLYGTDFNDMRGLVAHGDYSLPIINSAWSNYQMNNKNYQQIFNREIEHMEIEHKQDLITGILGSGASALGQGIGAGALFGGPAGIASGAISAGLGVVDTLLGEQRYQEGKSFKTDIFNLQLGNIKAMPNTISKSTPLTFNNKIFPILEFYTCTSIERNALYEKIKYNGMTVGRIDKITNFDKGFFRGRLIINTAIADDAHLLSDISQELERGIYLYD